MSKAETMRVSISARKDTIEFIDAAADSVGMSRSQVISDLLDASAPIFRDFAVSAQSWPVTRFDLYEDLMNVHTDNGDKLMDLFGMLKRMGTPDSVITGVTPTDEPEQGE
ncbi:MAG: ribbon-helix-helix domain-containing protein [Propionibacteriaceae bacterium]|jgi:hypothetical protein|nr:ribbon-helix-helix domain-containing protein [Propionibacteriaceae bacterium]